MNTELHMASAPRAENPEDTRNHCQPRLTGGCSTQPTTKRIGRALSPRQAVGAGAPDLPQQAPGLQQSLVPHPLLLRGLRTNCVCVFFFFQTWTICLPGHPRAGPLHAVDAASSKAQSLRDFTSQWYLQLKVMSPAYSQGHLKGTRPTSIPFSEAATQGWKLMFLPSL